MDSRIDQISELVRAMYHDMDTSDREKFFEAIVHYQKANGIMRGIKTTYDNVTPKQRKILTLLNIGEKLYLEAGKGVHFEGYEELVPTTIIATLEYKNLVTVHWEDTGKRKIQVTLTE